MQLEMLLFFCNGLTSRFQQTRHLEVGNGPQGLINMDYIAPLEDTAQTILRAIKMGTFHCIALS